MKKNNANSGFFENPAEDLRQIRVEFELFSARLEESYLLASQAGDVRGMLGALSESRKFLERRLDRLEQSLSEALSGRRKLTVEDYDEIVGQMEDSNHEGQFTVPLLRPTEDHP
jgi:hypothetical protein